MDNSLRGLLQELETFAEGNDARVSERTQMMLNITPDTGEFLAILVHATKAKRILEIGTSNGYSTIWLADAVRNNSGSIVTLERLPAKADMARHNFERAGLMQWIHQEVTDAGDFLRQRPPESFEFLFLDSARSQYVSWWPAIQKVLSPGGLLVVDNATSHPAEVSDFISQVKAVGWRQVVVPIGKGEYMAVKPRPNCS